MKTLKVTQCQVGRFNMLSNEKSLSFYMSIFDDGVKVEENGILAQLYYSGEEDDYELFSDAINNIEEVFSKCYEYAERIISNTDYKAQCHLFYKVYMQNLEEINNSLLAAHKESVEKQIKKLQEQLKVTEIACDISYTADKCIKKRINLLYKWIEQDEKTLSELIPGTETHIKKKALLDRWKAETHALSHLLYEAINKPIADHSHIINGITS